MKNTDLAQSLLKAKSDKAKETALSKVARRITAIARELEKAKVLQQEMDELKAALCELSDRDYVATSAVMFEDDNIEIEFSAKPVVRTIKSLPKLFDHLGKKKFLEHASFSLKTLDKLVPKDEQADLVSKKRVGTRVCKITLL